MHGGDIYGNRIRLDFSVNVNPLGAPEGVLAAAADSMGRLENYPDPSCRTLVRALANHFGLAPEQVLCGNGASELLMACCHALRPGKAFLPAPGFYGYRYALSAVDCSMYFYLLPEAKGFVPEEAVLEQIREIKPELCFWTNPNNPTGVLTDRGFLEKLAAVGEELGMVTVVDECFLELTEKPEDYSAVSLTERYPHLLVLRAFTKSFAIPGLRLGYLLGNPALLAQLRRQLPEWNVSIPAQAAGCAALREAGYLEKAGAVIAEERAYLARGLRALGYRVYDSRVNYLLFAEQCLKGETCTLYEKLLERGILIRDCSDYVGLGKGYYRIAVKTHEANRQLLEEIGKIVGEER